MIVTISTTLACSAEDLWKQIIEPKSLQFVASPMLTFVPMNEGDLSDEWKVNTPYPLRIFFFGILPLGKHTINLIKIDKQTNTIVSQETGQLARVWNHTIHFQETDYERVLYTDIIEIKAGLLTPFIVLFAHIFYRHRQKRWKVLLHLNHS
jgi:hypothetical protein